MDIKEIKDLLDAKYDLYNRPEFIETDPIQVPHLFDKKEDIEISAFLAATIAWGQRKTIIKNAHKIVNLMDNDPFNFIADATEKDLNVFNDFKHRTINNVDMKFFVKSLQNIYKNHGGLENVFTEGYEKNKSIKDALIHFRKIFFEIPYQQRTQRHISNVEKKSAAKRLNMFIMWMVRSDNRKVHFGLWKQINMADLMLPLDIHTGNTSRKLGLINRKQNDWIAVEQVTKALRNFDPKDPVKYDFALFGLGIFEKF